MCEERMPGRSHLLVTTYLAMAEVTEQRHVYINEIAKCRVNAVPYA